MSTFIKPLTLVGWVLAAAMLAAAGLVQAGYVEKAVDRAIDGKKVKWVELNGEKFHIHPVKYYVDPESGRVVARGKISHHLRLRPDDEVSYRVRLEGGEVRMARITGIRNGGLSTLLEGTGPVRTVWKTSSGLTRNWLKGDWKDATRYLIGLIASRLPEAAVDESEQERDHRGDPGRGERIPDVRDVRRRPAVRDHRSDAVPRRERVMVNDHRDSHAVSMRDHR